MFCIYFSFLLFLFLFIFIFNATGAIFAQSPGLVELRLQMISLYKFVDPSTDVAVATSFCWFYPQN